MGEAARLTSAMAPGIVATPSKNSANRRSDSSVAPSDRPIKTSSKEAIAPDPTSVNPHTMVALEIWPAGVIDEERHCRTGKLSSDFMALIWMSPRTRVPVVTLSTLYVVAHSVLAEAFWTTMVRVIFDRMACGSHGLAGCTSSANADGNMTEISGPGGKCTSLNPSALPFGQPQEIEREGDVTTQIE